MGHHGEGPISPENVHEAVERELDRLLGAPPGELVEAQPSGTRDLNGLSEQVQRLSILRHASG